MRRKPDQNAIFGERLRGLRSERGYSMERLCDEFNASQDAIKLNRSTICRYENGLQEPMLSTVAALAKFLGVSPVYLIGRSDDRSYLTAEQDEPGVLQITTSPSESELLRIFRTLSLRDRTKLLSLAFELEENQKKEGDDER